MPTKSANANKEAAPPLTPIVSVSIVADATWRSHFSSISSLLRIGKGQLFRLSVNYGLPIVVKKFATPELLSFIQTHLDAMNGKGNGDN